MAKDTVKDKKYISNNPVFFTKEISANINLGLMLNFLVQFFFAYLYEKSASRILRDNYFAPERKLKLTRPVSRGNRAMTSL